MNTQMETPHFSSEESLMSTIYPSLGCYFSNFPNSCSYVEGIGHTKFSLLPRTLQHLHHSSNLDQMAGMRANPRGNSEAETCVPFAVHWPSQIRNHPSCTGMQTSATENPLQYGGAAPGKRRIRWTRELHEQFIEAVNQLGGAMNATPKGILRLMKSNELTIFHIKSHLQKYRAVTPQFVQGKGGSRTGHARKIPSSDIEEGLHVAETLRLPKGAEISIEEHLQAQRNLQARIEAHTGYLRGMFVRQERSSDLIFDHHVQGEEVLSPSAVDFSSSGQQADCGETHLNKAEQFETKWKIIL